MGSLQVLLGKTRQRRRTATNRNWLAGLDATGRPNFLYVTDTVRKKRLVEADFVGYRGGAAFAPEVETVSGLLATLVRRHGDGRTLWARPATTFVAEDLLSAGGWPDLVGLGRHGAEALARHHEAWSEAGQPRLPSPRGQRVEPFLRALDERLEGDSVRTTTAAALRRLEASLHRPSEALAAWLTRQRVVVIDDVLHPSLLRRDLLVALARAWAALGSHVLLCFESGQDLGGAEAGRFFEWTFFTHDEGDPVSVPLRPFAAARTWRRHVFTQLVAEGGEAEIVLAGADAVLLPVTGVEEPTAREAPDLADAWYADPPVATSADRVALHAWADPEAEARGIAREVKRALLRGERASDLWVAFPGLSGWAGRVARAFEAVGVPFELSTGAPLPSLPLVQDLCAALRLPAEAWPLEETLRRAAGPVLGLVESGEAFEALRAARALGLHALDDAGWPPQLQPAITRIRTGLSPLTALATPQPALAWRDAVRQGLDALGVLTRLEERREPGSSRSEAAFGAFLTAVDEVALAAAAATGGPWEPLRLLQALEAELATRHVPTHVLDADRVPVVGLLELRGIHPPRLWIGGLVAGEFPASTEDWLLAHEDRRLLDLLDPNAEARYLLGSALRNAQEADRLAPDGPRLTLSWSRTRAGRPLARSPLLDDLLQVPLLGDPPGARLVSLVRDDPDGAEPLGREEVEERLGALLGAGAPPEDLRPWVDLLGFPVLDFIAPLAARRGPAFGAWDGILDPPPPGPEALSVTRLETYVRCPARYYYERVLGLAADEEHTPDLDAATRGKLLHAVLRRFLSERAAAGSAALEGLEGEELHKARARLHGIGLELLGEGTAPLPPELRAHHTGSWLGGLVDDDPPGILHAWLEAERSTRWGRRPRLWEEPLPPYEIAGVPLRGQVDRVDDLAEGEALVVDYKTGAAPAGRLVREGLAIQGLVYLEVLAAGQGAVVYQELRRASDVKFAGWGGAPEVVRRLAPQARGATLVDDAGRAAHLAWWADSTRRLLGGVFHPTLAAPELAGCPYCPFQHACRRDEGRAEDIAAMADPRWHPPRRPDGVRG